MVDGREVNRNYKMHLVDENGVFCGEKRIAAGITPEALTQTDKINHELMCGRCRRVKYQANPARTSILASQQIVEDLLASGKISLRVWW